MMINGIIGILAITILAVAMIWFLNRQVKRT